MPKEIHYGKDEEQSVFEAYNLGKLSSRKEKSTTAKAQGEKCLRYVSQKNLTYAKRNLLR
ncbi:hypothetical protein BHE74_00031762 [Ensete ventricosum]|nr:hypothetical protein BHE74_00031762 [Ensete ventricosum]